MSQALRSGCHHRSSICAANEPRVQYTSVHERLEPQHGVLGQQRDEEQIKHAAGGGRSTQDAYGRDPRDEGIKQQSR